MTRVSINPGACGFVAVVEVKKQKDKDFSLAITSQCQMVQKMAEELKELTMMDAFKRLSDNPVYKKAAVYLRHAACPVPSGILKALEVEAGLNLPKDCSIIFEK